MVEREVELATLRDIVASALAGEGHVVLVTGPVGCGKTELLRALAEHAVSVGARCLDATASRIEQALPLGVLSQLFRSATLPPDSAARVARLLDDGAFTAMLNEPVNRASEQVPGRLLLSLCRALLDLSEGRPLVVAVDDIQYADVPSLQCLAYLSRRLRSTRTLVVLTELVHSLPTNSLFEAELLLQPHHRRIQLATLSRQGVAAMLTKQLPEATARRLAGGFHRVSGGNPVLVKGLLADYRATWSPSASPAVGPKFIQALVACLHRGDAPMLDVARGLAVLGAASSPALVGQLMGLSAESASQAMSALSAAGLLDEGYFRHPATTGGILDSMIPGERSAAAGRAARLLAASGASATVVARHLLTATNTDATWALPVLHDAAEQALADADIDLAIACLRRARLAAGDDAARAASTIALARAEWQANPAIASRHIDELIHAAYAGHLSDRQVLTLVGWLLWFGRLDDALPLLREFQQRYEELDAQAAEALITVRVWLAALYPLAGREHSCAPHTESDRCIPGFSPRLQAARLLEDVMRRGQAAASVAEAEQILHSSRLDGRTITAIGIALAVLVYSDRLAIAVPWCDRAIQEAQALRARTWEAIFSVQRAEIAIRQGDLPGAERYARTALGLIDSKSWGIAIGAPLAILTQAYTAMGRHRDAMNNLQVPVPNEVFQTPIGLLYLRARGRYFYAIGRFSAALADFQSCGDLMERWDFEIPAFVPWWSDAAEACLKLGDHQRARDLVAEQMTRLSKGHLRTLGQTLRVLSAASEPERQPVLLERAVDALEASGDRLELAYVLADLGHVYHLQGDSGQARTALRRAQQLARQCGARLLDDVLPAEAPTGSATSGLDDPGGADPATRLSDAERRVAALAARGHTNREIADRLFVTVSTVEQHLTRVYRKLDVTRRGDLPVGLRPDTIEPA